MSLPLWRALTDGSKRTNHWPTPSTFQQHFQDMKKRIINLGIVAGGRLVVGWWRLYVPWSLSLSRAKKERRDNWKRRVGDIESELDRKEDTWARLWCPFYWLSPFGRAWDYLASYPSLPVPSSPLRPWSKDRAEGITPAIASSFFSSFFSEEEKRRGREVGHRRMVQLWPRNKR